MSWVYKDLNDPLRAANQIFLSAMKVSGVDLDEIKEKYEAFLNRILKRINREIEQTVIEYQKAMQNVESIVEAIRNNDVYKDALKDGQDTLIAEEEIYIELNDEDSKGMDPYISISYPSGNYYVWFSIQNGEMTYFDVSKNQDN